MRTRYRLQLDPSIEDAKRFCQTMRRTAKDERVLFHYNGHGVPKPTSGGEIWVFNRNFTQYIPVPIYDFMGYLGTPCLYVWDCSAAGHIIEAFKKFAEQRDAETLANGDNAQNPARPPFGECIHLAACHADQVLPMNPDLPADLFTSCLTTPIDMALRVFILQNPLLSKITVDQVKKIPGRASDRKSPRGELYWIFTSVTDTIAWSVLPRTVFKKLFRQDLMVAALFRNYLLADRIMRQYNCTPMSNPQLPETHNHPMWDAWDLAIDQCINQMPEVVAKAEKLEKEREERERHNPGDRTEQRPEAEVSTSGKRFSTFFEEQLTAFEVWLQTAAIKKEAPMQLPIVLQVLRTSHFHACTYPSISIPSSSLAVVTHPFPRPGTLGRQPRPLNRHIPLRLQTPPLPRRRSQSNPNLHLGAHPRRR
jgi:regulatory associated protein of mTOR